jgi:hypothetical protein
MFFVQINHTGKGFLFLIFREIKLRKYSSLHKLFYGLGEVIDEILTGNYKLKNLKKYANLFKSEISNEQDLVVVLKNMGL